MDDPKPTFAYLVSRIAEAHPSFAYIHVTEARVNGNVDREVLENEVRPISAHVPSGV